MAVLFSHYRIFVSNRDTLFKKELIQTTPVAFLYKKVLELITIMSYIFCNNTDCQAKLEKANKSLGTLLKASFFFSLRTSKGVFHSTGI